jgi:cardiolipin synthase
MLVFWIVVASILATILALNFIPGEKKLETRISELYAVQDPQFLRTISHLLGPPLVAGNQVQELINGDGSVKMDDDLLKLMEDAGVELHKYHPLHWYHLARANNRTHRKLLVIDGTVGFTGGVGIADNWLGDAQNADHWRDSHFRIEGPAVAHMQAAFLDNWMKTSG